MVIYADVLIVLNLLVDYFLLSATALILQKKVKTLRIAAGALLGGLSSLYIFVPNVNIVLDFIFKLSVSALMAFTCFGFANLKQYLKSVFMLFAVTCGYAGVMIALWRIFKLNGILINNSVVYFNISPVVLVGSTVVAYFIFMLLTAVFKRSARTAEACKITLIAENKSAELSAIVDTGNSISDTFGKSEIIIADRSVAGELFGETDFSENELIKTRYRAVPCATVSGGDMLDGFRCDKALVMAEKGVITLEKPILAVSKLPLNDGYNAIINPKILE